LYTAVLVTLLLTLSLGAEACSGQTVVLLRSALNRLRAALGLGTPWKRNSCSGQHRRKKLPQKPKNP
jgi:hypothetical protein